MSKLSVALMGDICMRGVESLMTPDYARRMLEKMQGILRSCDLRVANLENAICAPDAPIRKCGPNLCQTREHLCFLSEANVDCTVLANNHVGDFGPEGVVSTLDELDAAGFPHVGAGRDLDEAYIPWYGEKNGVKLAVVACCENEFGGATLTEAGTAALDLARVAAALRQAREQADFVILVMHGGNEYNPLPSPNVRSRYRTFAELGADAVIGMHPHCIQGYEFYRGTPIVYSTGNFMFPGSADCAPSWYRGYVPELRFETGKPVDLILHPYHMDEQTSFLTPYEDADRETMLAYIASLSAYIQDESLLRRYFDGWCMITGVYHAQVGSFDPAFAELSDYPKGHRMYAVRNIRTCEAHNELVTNYCRMLLEGRVEAGLQMAEKLKVLQQMPV